MEPWFDQGLEALQRSEFSTAVELLERCAAADPSNPRTKFLLGTAYHGLGRLDRALVEFERSFNLDSGNPEPLNAMAVVLDHLGDNARACECCERALSLEPDNYRYLTNLGGLLENRDPARALAALDRALALAPDPFDPLLTRGAVLCTLGRFDDALTNNLRLAKLRPENPNSYFNVADVLLALRRFEDAVAAASQALEVMPAHSGALLARGIALSALGKLAEGQAALAQAVSCDETLLTRMRHYLGFELGVETLDARIIYLHAGLDRFAQCDWTHYQEFIDNVERILRETNREDVKLTDQSLLFRCAYLPIAGELKAELANSVSDHIAHRVRQTPAFWIDQVPRPSDGRLRIGYIASDIASHPGAYAARPLYSLHDRRRFEVFVYALNPNDGSAVRRSIAQAADTFRAFDEVSDEDAAYQIYQDNIDVLIDLSGYSFGSRNEVLAHQPAPVQIAFHGYHETMGATFITYHVLDARSCPPELNRARREAPIYLPHCMILFDDQTVIDAAGPDREEAGLPEDAFVFSAFHQSIKLDPAMFATWMRILHHVPGSILWLPQYHPQTMHNLLAMATTQGISRRRLVFAPRLARSTHLARLGLADLALDAGWYNAHTTALETLWAGCPLLTLRGESAYARIGAAILESAGLPDLITERYDDYFAQAVRIARDPGYRAEISAAVRAARSSPAFDSAAHTRALEDAYTQAWEGYKRGDAPRPIWIPDRDPGSG